MIENIMFGGLFVLSLFQMYTVFYQNQTKIIEIIEKLKEHYPHSGIDQFMFKVPKYLKTTKFHENGYYLITTVLWTIIFVTFYYICTDMLFANMTQVLCMELDILGQIMSKIDPDKNEEEAIKELKKLVDIHQQLIEVSEKLQEIFSPLQLINAFGSIAALCTAIFLVMQLIDSSSSISTSAYNIKWYSGSVKFQRLVLQVLVRSQKPQTITAWKFFDMSLETFQWIVNTSYTYFTVLQGTYGS
ncbi:putative odorant receptor 92a [Chironomus tepperi]|uniref:putative odorant receptor 92a n=1 Tax=Chironomus tepperi TaxID=113505 RepID=UPI00391F618D